MTTKTKMKISKTGNKMSHLSSESVPVLFNVCKYLLIQKSCSKVAKSEPLIRFLPVLEEIKEKQKFKENKAKITVYLMCVFCVSMTFLFKLLS